MSSSVFLSIWIFASLLLKFWGRLCEDLLLPHHACDHVLLCPVVSNYVLWTQWAQDEHFPKFSCVWCGLSSYLAHGWKNGFYLQASLCKQVCLNPAGSDLRFFHLFCFSEVTGNLHYFLFGHLATELIFSHLGPPLRQRAGLHCEGSESTSSGCVVLGAAHTP